ncbi:gliding motility protein GldM [Pontibacter sp. BT310]|jgi:gliding motility-associated protein GldM|uniref:Gliding motility protein GldM n=1 Tax=Pontibacter populi TaxID=890055 RepID=A0ABS6X9J0_9BACT|nr:MULTISPECIES: gliding motility protein GldM [Pontibacter]MBJ6117784.1 gliding motility protein GldM [Pontibacter sp. BT310]MBR0570210.1 gliding motility protein GldM [Microvirga sp. STS03]MBW3364636.1 gliding motility protein GldM [Pontibacter populi]
MAGGKETPRQKMIGMMYLVLTALLALQVNSAILLKFQFLDESLLEVNSKTVNDNAGVLTNIKSAVNEGGNRSSDARVLNNAQEIRKQTSDMVNYIRGLREKLVKVTGGMNEEIANQYANPSAEDKVAMTMIGAANKKNGSAYELKDKLNTYAKFLKQYNPNMPAQLANDGKEDPVAKNDKSQRNKDFAELNFENTPLVAALAVLSQKENEVLKYEADALQKLATQVGADIIKFEKIFAMARAESKTVAAGTKYKADMFIAASSDAITPTMTFQGKPVKVVDGKGIVEFTAAASNYDAEGNSKQTWKGQIKINQNGRDTVFTVEEDYVVAKPVIQVQSAAVQALYFQCANELNIQVPALGATYDPSFSASGGSAIKGAKKGLVTVIPSAAEVRLSVSSGGNAIGSETFKVRPIPKPEVVALVNGRPVDMKRGVPASSFRQVTLDAVADEGFKQLLPNEARFRVTKWRAFLVRNNRPIDQAEFNSPTANLTNFASKATKGDVVYIEVVDVKRLNYKGQAVDAKTGRDLSWNIPLN